MLIALRDGSAQLVHVRQQILNGLLHDLIDALSLVVWRHEVLARRRIRTTKMAITLLHLFTELLIVALVFLDHLQRVARTVESAARGRDRTHVAIAQRLEARLLRIRVRQAQGRRLAHSPRISRRLECGALIHVTAVGSSRRCTDDGH